MTAKQLLLIIGMASSLLLVGCGDEQTAETVPAASAIEAPVATIEKPADDTTTIVVLGDSLTAGFGLSTMDALPEQMEALFHAEGREDITFVNAGVSGDTTGGGLARYDWSVASANPNVLIVALGANDFFGGVEAGDARNNLAAIIERAQSDDVLVILASVEAGEIADVDERVAAYAEIYPELAETYNVPLYKGILSGVRDQPRLLQPDGLHPTKDGVAIMAERLSTFLKAYLPEA